MSDSSFKNRNMLVLFFEILIIVVAIGGLTLAATTLMNGSSNTILTFGEYNVDYVGETHVVFSDLEPISDSLINYNTRDNVIRLEFSLRGVDTNDKDDLIYDIMLSDINIDCSLLNEYTKWNLYKDGNLLYNGSLDPKFDGNVLTDNMRLTEMKQDLPKADSDYDKYVLIIWISEACDDLINCEYVDQSNIVNSNLDMKVFIAVSTGKKVLYERIPNLDATCVNKPILYNNMLPVYYDNGNVKVASYNNLDNVWYDYGRSKWANAVVVNTDKYNDSRKGTIISVDDILSYYVWVPRFKYRLWNSNDSNVSFYDAYKNGIDIVFESGINSTGDIKCVDDRCLYKNNQYLTHPAFANDLRGFWISKYEISEGNKFVPNVDALRNQSLEDYNNIINNLNKTYSLSDNVLSHMVTNSEWGATLYLSHSKYGVCSSSICEKIVGNNSYISGRYEQDSTTGNIYGVYDMAGASSEYTVGVSSFGSALLEVLIDKNTTWGNGYYDNNDKDYIIRGGLESGLYSALVESSCDVSTRSVLVNK